MSIELSAAQRARGLYERIQRVLNSEDVALLVEELEDLITEHDRLERAEVLLARSRDVAARFDVDALEQDIDAFLEGE